MGRVMQLASFSLAEVTYATGDISYLVQEQAKSASFKVKAKQENVSGVVLPAFEVDRVPGTGAQPSLNAPYEARLTDIHGQQISTSLVSDVADNKCSDRKRCTQRLWRRWLSSHRSRQRL